MDHPVVPAARTVASPDGDAPADDVAVDLGGCLRVGRVINTTKAIESLNMQLRKIIKTRGHFPNDESAIKLLWLARTPLAVDRFLSLSPSVVSPWPTK